MAAITASDVTYTFNRSEDAGGEGYKHFMTIAYGDGSLTYAAAGVPLTKASMGCPNAIVNFQIVESNLAVDGYVIDYDKSANTLLLYQTDLSASTDAGLIPVTTSDTPAATSVEVVVTGY